MLAGWDASFPIPEEIRARVKFEAEVQRLNQARNRPCKDFQIRDDPQQEYIGQRIYGDVKVSATKYQITHGPLMIVKTMTVPKGVNFSIANNYSEVNAAFVPDNKDWEGTAQVVSMPFVENRPSLQGSR